MYRSRRSSPALPTRITLYSLTNNADEKDVVGRMPLFKFYTLIHLVNYPSRCGLTAYPGATLLTCLLGM